VTDDLGLDVTTGERGAPGRGPSYGKRRLVVAVVLLAAVALLVIVAVVGVNAVKNVFGGPSDYSGAGFGSVQVEIKPGESLTQIGSDLADAGVVASSGAFTDAASNNDKASTIGPGTYRLHRHMSGAAAVTLLLDPSALLQARVVVPEGRRMRDIIAAIAQSTGISTSDLETAAKDPNALGVPSWGRGHSLEGFLFPATYTFQPKTTATQALSAMVTRFNQEATSIHLVKAAKQTGLSPYDVLTLASIIEREGRLTADFPKIAEVFYNRLHRGMALQSDATLYYVLDPGHGALTNSDLRLDSPYNTRINVGLPPTPIASPGTTALDAALHPAHGPYLYFVTIDKAGHAAFATTLDRFNQLVAESRRNGVQ
jgi:UPF0755 protein